MADEIIVSDTFSTSDVTTFRLGNCLYNYRDSVSLDALDQKVDKVEGMGLSEKNFSATQETKLNGIEAGAQVNPVIENSFIQGSTNLVQSKVIQDGLDALDTKFTNLTGFATSANAGIIKVGSGLNIDLNGTLSITPNQSYPVATRQSLGVVQIGDRLSVNSSGEISADVQTPDIASTSAAGIVRIGDGINIDPTTGTISTEVDINVNNPTTGQVLKYDSSNTQWINANESSYTLPTASDTTKGGIKVGDGLDINNAVLSIPTQTPFLIKNNKLSLSYDFFGLFSTWTASSSTWYLSSSTERTHGIVFYGNKEHETGGSTKDVFYKGIFIPIGVEIIEMKDENDNTIANAYNDWIPILQGYAWTGVDYDNNRWGAGVDFYNLKYTDSANIAKITCLIRFAVIGTKEEVPISS